MFDQTPLIVAAGAGQEAVVRALLEAGADPAAVTGEGKDAGMVAREEDHPEIAALLSAARTAARP
jgi:ankyrin repeat protein